jgi:hypothetical protein
MVTTQTEEIGDDEAFMRSITWCQEDLMSRHQGVPWNGYRWFRSPNIIPLERFKALKVKRLGPLTPKE